MASPSSMSETEFNNMNMNDLKENYLRMFNTLQNRRATCRKSSKQYYNKTFKLNDNPTAEDIQKQKKVLTKRDNYQKTYYEKNKERIKERQRTYRLRKKEEEREEETN